MGTRCPPVDRMPKCRQCSDMQITRAYIQACACCKLVVIREDFGDVVEDLERKNGLVLRNDRHIVDCVSLAILQRSGVGVIRFVSCSERY